MEITSLISSLDNDPRFIVGYRKPSGLMDCYMIDIHQDLFEDFREIGRDTLDYLGRSTERPYAPFGALEDDQYFTLERSDVPSPAPTGNEGGLARNDSRLADDTTPHQLHGVAEALRIIDETDQHPVLPPADLHSKSKLNFYAISFQIDNGFVGFIRQTNPRRSLKPGLRYLQYGDTLKRMQHPDIVIDERVDMVVDPEDVAIISEKSMQVLFRDVEIVMQGVDANAADALTTVGTCIAITTESLDALRLVCGRGPRNAKRLHDLVHFRLPHLDLDQSGFLAALKQRQLDQLVPNGRLHLTESDVPDFLDFIEGRLFDDDHSPETRRADRYSTR